MIRLFVRKATLSSSLNDYGYDFDRAKYVFCASSSLILDAFNEGYSDKLVWVKPFGLTWDYYDLERDLNVVHSTSEITTVLEKYAV